MSPTTRPDRKMLDQAIEELKDRHARLADELEMTQRQLEYYRRLEAQAEGQHAGQAGTPAPAQDVRATATDLGLDLTCPFELHPSSTPGHAHLFLDVTVSWKTYARFLRTLHRGEVIETSYLKMSLRRGATHLRLPWVAKYPGHPRQVPTNPKLPGTMDRELLTWTTNAYWLQDYTGDELIEEKVTIPAPNLREADLITSRIMNSPDLHAPMLDLDDGGRIDPLSGRLILHIENGPRAARLARKAFARLGVLGSVDDRAQALPPALP